MNNIDYDHLSLESAVLFANAGDAEAFAILDMMAMGENPKGPATQALRQIESNASLVKVLFPKKQETAG